MASDKGPLVSCIMPSINWGGPLFNMAVESFNRQTYMQKELIWITSHMDHGPDRTKEYPPTTLGKHVVRSVVPPGLSIGELRNVAIRIARGSIIAHWDDDDWSHPARLERQVEELTAGVGINVCGSSKIYYHDPGAKLAWLLNGSKFWPQRKWLSGGTLAYWRHAKAEPWFDPTLQYGEDTKFMEIMNPWGGWGDNEQMRTQALGKIVDLADPTMYVATIHDNNTCAKATTSQGWSPVDYEIVEKVMAG